MTEVGSITTDKCDVLTNPRDVSRIFPSPKTSVLLFDRKCRKERVEGHPVHPICDVHGQRHPFGHFDSRTPSRLVVTSRREGLSGSYLIRTPTSKVSETLQSFIFVLYPTVHGRTTTTKWPMTVQGSG